MKAKYVQAFMTDQKDARIIAWQFWPIVGWEDNTALDSFETLEIATVGNVFLLIRKEPTDTWPAPRRMGTVVYASFLAMMKEQGFLYIEPVEASEN
jgi:hypothetical protein